MQNIVELNTMSILNLAEAATRADAEGRTLRIVTGTNGSGETWLKYKVGEGMWSAPQFGIPQIAPRRVGEFIMTVE